MLNLRELFRTCIDEMYPMEKGYFIAHPDEIVLQIGDASLTRRQVKHIIEQRKAEGKSIAEVENILNLLPTVIAAPDFEMPNYNQKYIGSILRVKLFDEQEPGIVVVMDKGNNNGVRSVITAHLYSAKKIYLLKKKLHATAVGKTPHP